MPAMTNLKPLGDRIIVSPTEAPAPVSEAGLEIVTDGPERDETRKGNVVAAGPKTEICEGDAVAFNPYAGEVVKDGGTEYLVLREAEVLAVVNGMPPL